MFRIRRTWSVRGSWIAAAAAAALYVVTGWAVSDVGTGLVRTVVTTTHRDISDRVRATAVSRGVWDVHQSGLYDLRLDGRGRVLDGGVI